MGKRYKTPMTDKDTAWNSFSPLWRKV
jgi:hypothetical protein